MHSELLRVAGSGGGRSSFRPTRGPGLPPGRFTPVPWASFGVAVVEPGRAEGLASRNSFPRRGFAGGWEGLCGMAHLYRVILPVGDIERAAAFYAAVLGDPGRRVSPGRHYFDCEGTILACFDPQADGDGYAAKPNPEPLYFAVADLRSVYERVRERRGGVCGRVAARRGSARADRAAAVGRGVVLRGRSVRQSALLRRA